MIQLGYYAMCGALVAALTAIVFAVFAFRTGREDLQASARHAVWATAFFTTLACAGIVYAFLMGDYQMEYVWGNSDRDMPTFYKLGALWGGQSGSLLFWGWLLSMYSALVSLRHRRDHVRLMAPTTATLMTVASFFLALVVFGTNPFRRAAFIPLDGVGLNPLLQHPAMVIHPPCLYLGMIGFTVPFAFAVGALVSGRLDNEWLKKARLWAVVAWLFLGAGNILGGWWAYLELGWGGYWAWDPVENASFMPWLAGTAYIHSAMIQERKQMLKIWNMVLILSTFVLTVMGTFITRSGLISSVHSFAQSNIGYYFAGFLLVSILVSLGLIVWRRNELKSQQHLDSYLSRESAFLFGNLILLGGAFAVLWGTLFPMFTEAIKGTRISLGPPFFNQFMIPVGLGVLFLMGIGPRIPWRRASWQGLGRLFTVPAGLSLAAVAVLLVLGVSHAYALVTFGFCAFVTGTILMEFRQGILARMKAHGENPLLAFLRLFTKGQRRYGGYIVHMGVVIIFIGFAGSAFSENAETTLGRGETWHFRDYDLTYRGLAVEQTPSVERIAADVLLAKDHENVAVMKPRKDWYEKNQQLASEVSIHATLASDIYLVLASFDEKNDRASFKLFWNPLVSWYWIGGIVMVLGGLLILLPLRRRRLA